MQCLSAQRFRPVSWERLDSPLAAALWPMQGPLAKPASTISSAWVIDRACICL